MLRFSSKLEIIKMEVKGWSNHNFGDIFITKKDLGSFVSNLQAQLAKGTFSTKKKV